MSGILTLVGNGSIVGVVGEGFSASAGVIDSVYQRTLLAVQSQLQALELASLAGASIVIRKLPLDRYLQTGSGPALPALVISPEGEKIDAAGGTNLFDDVTYGVRLTIFDRDNQEPTLVANLDRYLGWRQQIARAFRNQPLAGVAEIYTAQVEPAAVVDTEAWARNLFVESLLLWFVSREPRGAGSN